MNPEALAFIRAICANPKDDVARLVYADWLDYDGYSPRAELIRLQVGLARLQEDYPSHCEQQHNTSESPSHWCELCAWNEKHFPLECRESELLTQHAAEFRRGPKCEACGGEGKRVPESYRDFANGSRCKDCHGTGDLGGLMTRYRHKLAAVIGDPEAFYHDVTFHRGFPRVHCRMEECVQDRIRCLDCGDDKGSHGRQYCYKCSSQRLERYQVPTDWLLSVVRHHRGVEVWVTDREPFHFVTDKVDEWVWLDDDEGRELGRNRLPRWAFANLKGQQIPHDRIARAHKEYATKEEAQVALARAIPAWVRGHLAGVAT